MITLDDLANRPTITVPEAAALLGIGRDTAYTAARNGQIPALRLGNRWVIPTHRLLELLGADTHTNSEAPVATGAHAHIHSFIPRQEGEPLP